MKAHRPHALIPALLTACLAWLPLTANAANAACYQFSQPDGPEAMVAPSFHPELWCYERLAEPQGLYIYNADGPKVKPELAILVEPDGVITHGSLLAGKVEIHRVSASRYNPFSVPLKEPASMNTLQPVNPGSIEESAREVLKLLLNKPIPSINLAIGEGYFKASARYLPFRGYWWPYKGLPLYGPLSRYDQFVAGKTGANPGAAAWEASHHVYRGVWWEGHCNGWAASSLLREEPRTSRKDPQTGVVFSVSDQKGILASKDYCSTAAFFGNRNRGRASDIPADVFPAKFHNTLVYYIGRLGKPVAMDYHADPVVDNHVISGYSMNIEKTGANTFKVAAVLTVHKYDGVRSNTPGIAPTYTRTYRYTLETDADGNAVGGAWLTANPDFLWVPLSPTTCPTNNQRLDGAMVDAIMSLPASN